MDALVGSRIRERRMVLGLSQAKLAKSLGLTFSQVQKYEKGSNRVGAGRLLLIANTLGVPVTYFFAPRASGPDQDEDFARLNRTPLLEPEAEILVEAFRSISGAKARRALISLAKAMAEAEKSRSRPGPQERPTGKDR